MNGVHKDSKVSARPREIYKDYYEKDRIIWEPFSSS